MESVLLNITWLRVHGCSREYAFCLTGLPVARPGNVSIRRGSLDSIYHCIYHCNTYGESIKTKPQLPSPDSPTLPRTLAPGRLALHRIEDEAVEEV